MNRIGIIGGGFSGSLLTFNLIKNSSSPLNITIFDNRKEIGRGLAYSTKEDLHLLNVPVGKISAIHNESEHFYNWLKDNKKENYEKNSFVSRKIYGDYIQDIFEKVKTQAKEKNIIVNTITNTKINSLDLINNEIELREQNNEKFNFDKVVLAIGNYAPSNPNIENNDFFNSPNYYKDPWSIKDFEDFKNKESILIIGSGLTMIDIVMSLKMVNYKGKIYIISPHGYLPQKHQDYIPYHDFLANINIPNKALDIFKIVHQEVIKAEKNNQDWRAVIDSLRPYSQKIWINFSDDERKRFMKFVRHKWGVLRHRIPIETYNIFNEMINNNQISVLTGRPKNIFESNDCITVKYKKSKTNDIEELKTNIIINCTGPESNFEKLQDPLILDMKSKNLFNTDSLKLGINTNDDYNLLDRNNHAINNIYTIGSLLKGKLWESIAVPELRVQAYDLSKIILNNLKI